PVASLLAPVVQLPDKLANQQQTSPADRRILERARPWRWHVGQRVKLDSLVHYLQDNAGRIPRELHCNSLFGRLRSRVTVADHVGHQFSQTEIQLERQPGGQLV